MELKVATGVVIENDRGEVLLIQKSRGPYIGYWVVPGGRIIPGEKSDECAIREVKEETGLDVEIVKNLGFEEDITEINGKMTHLILPQFYAKLKGGRLNAADDAKDAKWFSKEELKKLKTLPTMIGVYKKLGWI